MKSGSKVALLEKNCTSIRQIGSRVLNTLESIERSRQISGIMCCDLMKVDLTWFGPTTKLRSGKRLKKHDPKCIVPTLQHGGENVKCCLFQVSGILSLSAEPWKERFIVIFHKKNLVESVKNLNLDQGWVLQHNNDPKYRAHTVIK